MIASGIVLERLSALQTGIFYGGVGAGILLTGVAVPLLAYDGSWVIVWKGLGIISLILGLAAWYLLRDSRTVTAAPDAPKSIHPAGVRRILICLSIAYGLEGLGYIVTGTYLVAYAKTVSTIPNFAALSWIFVGLAGIPSCIGWSALASRWGKKWTLTAAMILQAAGIAIPVVIPSTASIIAGAILFGATFMGITMLFVSYGKELYPQDNRKIVGLLTACFGLGRS